MAFASAPRSLWLERAAPGRPALYASGRGLSPGYTQLDKAEAFGGAPKITTTARYCNSLRAILIGVRSSSYRSLVLALNPNLDSTSVATLL